ncbi:hypothetical protein N9R79_05780 [Vibrio sp.]|nr:hypothetical protein [Vibrio sp.]
MLNFFLTLPLWLELSDFRVVHACWDQRIIEQLKRIDKQYLSREDLPKATTKGDFLYEAIETLLKGVEVELPHGVTFQDKDSNTRTATRVQWWKREATQLEEVVLPP